jgi:hypothetical protein
MRDWADAMPIADLRPRMPSAVGLLGLLLGLTQGQMKKPQERQGQIEDSQ